MFRFFFFFHCIPPPRIAFSTYFPSLFKNGGARFLYLLPPPSCFRGVLCLVHFVIFCTRGVLLVSSPSSSSSFLFSSSVWFSPLLSVFPPLLLYLCFVILATPPPTIPPLTLRFSITNCSFYVASSHPFPSLASPSQSSLLSCLVIHGPFLPRVRCSAFSTPPPVCFLFFTNLILRVQVSARWGLTHQKLILLCTFFPFKISWIQSVTLCVYDIKCCVFPPIICYTNRFPSLLFIILRTQAPPLVILVYRHFPHTTCLSQLEETRLNHWT